MIKNTIYLIILFSFILGMGQAQPDAIVHEGEIGASAGLAHYFGDINPNIGLKRSKPAIGIFYRKQFGNYVAMRFQGQFAQVGYADQYASDAQQKERNLSFNSDIKSLSVRGDFNFFKFKPGTQLYRFTPYVSVGIGLFWFNPYTYLPDNPSPQYLRKYKTEGFAYETRELIFPIGFGVKYNIRKNVNIGFELTHFATETDYLDDVSKVYKGPDAFSKDPVGLILQDRSDPSKPYGQAGKMRGFGSQLNDTYVTAELTLSISLSSYRCPTVY